MRQRFLAMLRRPPQQRARHQVVAAHCLDRAFFIRHAQTRDFEADELPFVTRTPVERL